MTRVDVFPSRAVLKLDEPLPSDRRGLIRLAEERKVNAFVPFLENRHVLALDSGNDWDRLTMDNFKKSVSDALSHSRFDPKTQWHDVDRCLSAPPTEKKNSDRRLSFRLSTHRFLVKKRFTFGQRCVLPGTVHWIETFESPILYFLLPARRETYVPGTRSPGIFAWEERTEYARYVLQPRSTYCVPTGSLYVLLTHQVTRFGLHVVDERVVRELGEAESPTRDDRFVGDPFQRSLLQPPIEPPLLQPPSEPQPLDPFVALQISGLVAGLPYCLVMGPPRLEPPVAHRPGALPHVSQPAWDVYAFGNARVTRRNAYDFPAAPDAVPEWRFVDDHFGPSGRGDGEVLDLSIVGT